LSCVICTSVRHKGNKFASKWKSWWSKTTLLSVYLLIRTNALKHIFQINFVLQLNGVKMTFTEVAVRQGNSQKF